LRPDQLGADTEGQNPEKTEQQVIEDALYSMQGRGSAYQELERRRREETAKLIEVVGEKDGPPLTRYFAARLLGLYSDHDAIPVLVKNIDWEYREGVVNEVSSLDGYPCAQALAQFGADVAIPVLRDLARMREEDINDRTLRLRTWLLEEVYANGDEPWGRDDVVGVVEWYIDRIPSDWPTARANVERLLEKLEKPTNER